MPRGAKGAHVAGSHTWAAEAGQVDTQPLLWGKEQAPTSWPGIECKWDSASLDTHTYVHGSSAGTFMPRDTSIRTRGRESRALSLIYDIFIDLPGECL